MKKRRLSLFLALALCLTLLPAAAFASGESETSTPHTHYLCGNEEACSQVGGHNEDSKTTFATAIRQDNNTGKVYVGGDPEEQPYPEWSSFSRPAPPACSQIYEIHRLLQSPAHTLLIRSQVSSKLVPSQFQVGSKIR